MMTDRRGRRVGCAVVDVGADVQQQRLELVEQLDQGVVQGFRRQRDGWFGDGQIEHGAPHASSKYRPMTGICPRRSSRTIALPTNAVSARPNSRPPSPFTSIPSTVRWVRIAPAIEAIASPAPTGASAGMNSSSDAISSVTAEPIRPHGYARLVGGMEIH